MIWLIIGIVAVLIIGIIFFVHNRTPKMNTEVAEIAKEYLEKSTSTGELSIKISALPALKGNEEKGLIEVTDKKILARIGDAVPGIANIAANAGMAHQASEVLKAGGQIYQAILPPGVVLCKSKEIEGAVRGFGRNAKNINAQANFLPVDGVMKKAAALNMLSGGGTLHITKICMSIWRSSFRINW